MQQPLNVGVNINLIHTTDYNIYFFINFCAFFLVAFLELFICFLIRSTTSSFSLIWLKNLSTETIDPIVSTAGYPEPMQQNNMPLSSTSNPSGMHLPNLGNESV